MAGEGEAADAGQGRDGEEGDDAVEKRDFFVVGIGSSAGGLEAIYEFLENLTPDSGLAYVLVSHRGKDHEKDRLLELIRKKSPVAVSLAEEGGRPVADRVYVAPGNGILGMADGAFRVTPAEEAPDTLMPIDAFFRDLARELGERAIGVVLSGMGSDGTAGFRDIKAAFGLCLAQSPDSARYESMPRNAMALVGADDVLQPGDMPEKLVQYVAHASTRRGMPSGEDDIPKALPSIFSIVKSRTGHDFSGYKRSTCVRRVARRMAVHSIGSARRYIGFLQHNPKEVDALVRELLILVTRFFRDADAFGALKRRLLSHLEERPPEGRPFRAWVVGCSTGEEAYSIAILLQECMAELDRSFKVQIFATDLSGEAIERARDPHYPAGIAQDVGPERLKRFFEKQEDGYRVKKAIREMLIFAPHNMINDPPFTRLDLLSCRNMLIYLDAGLQKQLMPTFHYALTEGGLFFLGGSETVGSHTDLFEPVDNKMRIYRRRPGSKAREGFLHARSLRSRAEGEKPVGGDPEDIGALHRRALLRHTAPASLVVDRNGEILSVYGATSPFLELPSGPVTASNLFRMAKNGLKAKLPGAVRHSSASSETVRFSSIRVRVNDEEHLVEGAVIPLTQEDQMEGLLLVLLADSGKPETVDAAVSGPGHRRTEDAEAELIRTRENLQTTVEELETANEELKSTNEELQSTNEELQSSNEELESAKEEQQSLNEELVTVNSELQIKIDELSEANDHMRNLLDNLQIPVLFLDNDLKIQRFTRKLRDLIKVIPGDVGRPVSDITTRLEPIDLTEIADEVLTTLVYKEQEVRIREDDGHWYQMRVIPYRSRENVIEGVVILFLDIQEKKEAMRESEQARNFAEAIVDTIREPLIVLDGTLTVVNANHSFYETFHLRSDRVAGRSIYAVCDGAWDIPELRNLLEESIRGRHFFTDFAIEQDFPHLGRRRFLLNARRLAGPREDQERILLTMEAAGGDPDVIQ